MELTVVGMEYSGKTSFVNIISDGKFYEDMIPTVGFNVRNITKGNIEIKIWDLGDHARFRSMWYRYCRGVNAIIFMVDAADKRRLEGANEEFKQLLDKAELEGIPILVLANKKDLPNAIGEMELIELMQLNDINDREICCYSISCKESHNIGQS